MATRKRLLLWDYTNTRDLPTRIEQVNFQGSIVSVANWNAWVPPELDGRLPYRPMVRTPAQASGEEWGWIRDGVHDTVHFYNEPERQGISPGDAAETWRSRMVGVLRKQKGKKLVGPSCASDPAGTQWLRDFMAAVVVGPEGGPEDDGPEEDYRPDYLGAHYYGADAGAAKEYLAALHDEFGLPVVVGEIACTDRDAAAARRWTVDLANWMDAQDWVREYGFFGCMAHVADDFVSPAAQLMNPDGSFTDLMNKLMTEQPMQ